MLVVRPAQMEALRRANAERIYVEHAIRLRERSPELCRDRTLEATTAMFRVGVVTAAQNGIFEPEHIDRYVELMARHGDDFQSTRWARAILHAPDWTAEEKLDALEAWVVEVTP